VGTTAPEHLARERMTRWPGKLFWDWSFRSQVKAISVGLVIGLGWMALASWAGSDQVAASRFGFIASFLIDTTFVYLACMLGTLVGIALQTWGIVGWVISQGKVRLIQGYMWALLLSLLVGVSSRYFQAEYGYLYDSLGVLGTNFMLTSVIAFTVSYRVYCLHATMEPSERRDYLSRYKGHGWRSRILLVAKRTLPFADKTKMTFGFLFAGVISLFIFVASYYLSRYSGNAGYMPLYHSILSCFAFSLFCNVVRFLDVVKLWGEKERLYPYFEDYR